MPRKAKAQNVRRAGKPPSGRMLLRMPAKLHGELLAEAERQQTSGNQLAVAFIAGALQWRQPKEGE